MLGGPVQSTDVLSALMSVTLDSAGQYLGADAFDRRFARRINIHDQQNVRVVEGAGELIHEIGRPRITMRLKEHDDAATWRADAGSAQRRFNFCRMMPVVVDDRNALLFAFELETPLRAAEF